MMTIDKFVLFDIKVSTKANYQVVQRAQRIISGIRVYLKLIARQKICIHSPPSHALNEYKITKHFTNNYVHMTLYS